ncbi:MAG: flavin monoamine oxidase family protein [Ktedonobacteraceae bacterium]
MNNSSTDAPHTTEHHATVVIVGVGLAGLSAARFLTASGVDVIVLEARDRVGGRTYTVSASDGTLLDLGGQWVGPTQHRIAALAQAVGATTFPTYVAGQNIEYRHGQRSAYSGAIPMHDPIVAMEAVEAMLDLNIMQGSSEDLVDIFWCDANPASNYMQGAIKTRGAQDNVMRLDAMSLLIHLEVTKQK